MRCKRLHQFASVLELRLPTLTKILRSELLGYEHIRKQYETAIDDRKSMN